MNAGASYLNFVVMALLGLLVNPFLLVALGAGTFGTWKACQRILDVATAADGGAPQALKWIVAHTTHEDVVTKQRTIGAALVIWLVWLPVLLVISLVTTVALPWLINNVGTEAFAGIWWTGSILSVNVVLAGLLAVPSSVLIGINRSYKAVLITTLAIVLANIAMIWTAWMGYGMPGLAACVLAGAIVGGALTLLIARRTVAWWGIRKPGRADVARMLNFSGWILVWSYIQRLFLSSEIILLSVLVGAVAASNYTFTAYVLQFALSICLMTTSAQMPKLGAQIGAGQLPEARATIAESHQLTLAIATFAGSGILLLNADFVALWVGTDNYMGDAVNALMVLVFVQLALLRADAQSLDAALVIKARALVGLASNLSSILLSWQFYSHSHEVAALYVGLIVGRLPASILFPILVARATGTCGHRASRYLVSVLMLAASYLAGLHIEATTWLNLTLSAVLAAAILSLCTLYFVLSPETRRKLLRLRPHIDNAGNP